MKICVLDDSYEESDSPLKEVDYPTDPTRYLPEHECEHHFIHKSTAVRQVIELSKRGFDVFINLCDGAWDEDRPGIEVVQALERLGLPFTGANSTFFEPSREKMKLVCHYNGIKTPAYVFATTPTDVDLAAANLRYPMIVKHPSSYSSIGLTPASRVMDADALHEQATIMIDKFGSALIEEFIEGREYSVLVAENPDDPANPIPYVPVEFCFPPGESFKHFDMKWLDYDGIVCVPCDDPELAARMIEATQKLFLGLDGVSYGRTDIRVNAEGEVYILEINPNCGVFYPPEAQGSADLILDYDEKGHVHFVNTIIRAALKRAQKMEKPWRLLLNRAGGYGMYAARPMYAGEIIQAFEEQPHYLVTRHHINRHWTEEQRTLFAQYAWPISDDTYVMWSNNPEEWKPINHSCDPNAWLDGLDMVARRNIAVGEQITVDYATFCGETMEAFTCSCGAAECRGIIRGTDYLEPFIARYGDHVSDYVQSKRHSASSWANDLSMYVNGTATTAVLYERVPVHEAQS